MTQPAPTPTKKPEKKEPSQLQTMANVSLKELKDRNGRTWKLQGLTFADYAEFERRVMTEGTGVGPFERNMYALWLSARKDGVSVEDRRSGKYAISFAEFKEVFDLSIVSELPKLVDELFKFSGFKAPEEKKPGGGGDKPAEHL